jgi:hypothetical protein
MPFTRETQLKGAAVRVSCPECAQSIRPLSLARHQASHNPWRLVDAEGDCWLWTGVKNKAGYGEHYYPYRRKAMAHRYIYELLVGPIPAGLPLDHLCRVPACVNPDHLEPVTVGENTRRGMAPTIRRWRARRSAA